MKRTAATAPARRETNHARMTPDGFHPGEAMARELRFAPSSYDSSARTVEAVFAAGSPVRRYGFVETINMTPEAGDLSRVQQKQCRLLDSHNAYEIDAILGIVEEARFEGGQLVGRIRFADTPRARQAEAMVAEGTLSGLSIGYSVQSWTNISVENDVETWRADKWTLLEVTLCAVPADPAAAVRSGATGQIAHIMENEDMKRSASAPAPGASTAAEPAAATAAAVTTETRAAPAAAPAPAPALAPVAEQRSEAAAPVLTPARSIALLRQCEGVGQRALAEQLISEGRDEPFVLRAVMEAAAARQAGNAAVGGPSLTIGRDETETRRVAMEDALARGLGVAGEVNEPARAYVGFRDLVEFAAERIGHRGRLGGFSEREDVLRRAHSTSDFPILLENAMNRALRARYEVAAPTYRRIASQRTYNDFRPHISVRDGDFPQLKAVAEGGEITRGTFGESKEQTSVKAFGIAVGFTRQLLVNDNLSGIQRVLANRATAVSRFEEETFYAMLLSASGAGPTLLETTRAVFNTTEGTLAASAAAITNASLGIARAAMRKMKTKDGTFLNIAPRILLVGPDKETEAQGVLSPLYAATAGNVPLFTNLLELVVSPQITGNAWYTFADIGQGANFEWGLLDGYTAPRFRIDEPFGLQGMACSLEHDFGCGAIDYRFGFRNAGA